jgi:hypothetical protein
MRIAADITLSTVTEEKQPSGGIRFDWIVIILCTWFRIGTYLDGWAHNHIPTLETFFTPWHAVLYSGFFAVAGFLGVNLLKNYTKGYSWQRGLPTGYELSILGALIFLIGGVGDLIWHELFGIEADLEALLSPTHLVLALGAALIMTGPLRAAWRRSGVGETRWFTQLPMILSVTYFLSGLTFMTQFAHPFTLPWAATGNKLTDHFAFFQQAVGILSILLQTELLMGLILLVVWRWGWRLPWGSLTLILTLNAIGMTFMARDKYLPTGRFPLIIVAALAGLVADFLLHRLKPSKEHMQSLRIFAFAVPVFFYLFYFLALKLTGGVWWSIHLWTGSILLAGIISWLLSYILIPPRLP